MKMLESYHFLTLRFHYSDDQGQFCQFLKNIAHLVIISIFCLVDLHFTLVVDDSSKLSTCESTRKKFIIFFIFV